MDLAVSEEEIVRKLCKKSFYRFVQEFWSVLISDKPVWNWHIKYICDELQKLAEDVINKGVCDYDMIINVPPGSTKSTICSQMLPAWIWMMDQRIRIISGSYSENLAVAHADKTKKIIQCDKFLEIFGAIKMSSTQDTKTLYENEKGGFRLSAGKSTGITGRHAHIIIVDDPLNVEQANSEAEILAANSWLNENLSTRKVNKEGCPTVLIMQRLHENDPTGDMLMKSKEGARPVKHICLPAEEEDGPIPESASKFYKDGLLDPVRISRRVVETIKVKLGAFAYACQFGQKPIARGGNLFKREKVVIEKSVPPKHEFTSIIRFWDKAATKGACAYSVGALIGKHMNGRFWVLDIERGRWSTEKREAMIKQTAELDQGFWGGCYSVGIEQEPGSGGKESMENTVKNLAGFNVIVDRPTGDKALRADPFSVQVNNGNVSVPAEASWVSAFLDELASFPAGRYKDQVDAASSGFALVAKTKKLMGGLW